MQNKILQPDLTRIIVAQNSMSASRLLVESFIMEAIDSKNKSHKYVGNLGMGEACYGGKR